MNTTARLTGLVIVACGARAAPERLFPPDSVIDVTRPPYEARPDDGRDDTAALQRVITEHVGRHVTLYLPAGTYDIQATLTATNSAGLWRPFLVLQGQQRERTILRLRDAAPGFTDPVRPAAMIATGSHWEPGDAADGGGNKAFRNSVFDLTLDTGRGNAGAVGVDYAVSNQGAIENVTVRSADGGGVAGISMRRGIPGPGLIQHVSVEGFGVGIDLDDIQYGMTLDDVEVRGQSVAGVRVGQNLLHARRLRSENRVPALIVTRLEGAVTLLDASLLGGQPDHPAIESEGNLLLRNVRIAGYREDAVTWRGARLQGPGDGALALPPAVGGGRLAPLVPAEETPVWLDTNLLAWTAVGPRQPGEDDDTAAIQRAIDRGRQTVYFPASRTYFVSDTVIVRGAVRHILGMGAELSLGAAEQPFSNAAAPRPVLRVDPGPDRWIEHLFFNAQYPGEVLIENNSPATLVIRHCAGWVGARGHRRTYRNTAAATGRVFIEDCFLPGWTFSNQQVWARQLNPENPDGDGVAPQVVNHGGSLWVLGFKTEGPAPFLATEAGGRTEMLGAYNYLSATAGTAVPEASVPYPVRDSAALLHACTENFRDSDYRTYIRWSSGSVTQEWGRGALPPRNGRSGDRSRVVTLCTPPSAP